MLSETGDWITLYDGQEDREATFERIATAARAFDSETGEMIAGEFTWTGDAHVQLFGTDLSETEWTPNELEEALNTIFTEDSTGYPEPPEDDGDGSDEDGSGGDGSGDGQSGGSEQSWWQWVLGGGGDWLDRNYSGGQYGDAGISGVILHTYSDLSTLLPGGGEFRDGVDILVGVDAAGNRLTTTERVVTLGMLAIPVIPTRCVRGPLMSAVDWMGTLAKKAPDAAIPTLAPKGAAVAEEGGLNLFKWNQPTSTRATGWRDGDRFLHLPNQGSARANWVQNSTRLRQEMRSGRPIFDSHVDDAGNLIPTQGFLNAERNLLMNGGWTFNPSTGAWHPPVGN
jgi:hypothetical protein